MDKLDLEIVMTHQTEAHDGRIVVGVDGSSQSKAAAQREKREKALSIPANFDRAVLVRQLPGAQKREPP
jgi:hypothetical protein